MNNQNILSDFGSSAERLQRAVDSLKTGGGVLLVDDENRENEGDLIFPAETITNDQMAMLIRECSGIVCLCLTEEKLSALDLPQMVDKNTNAHGTAFTVSIEAAEGVTTGVSAADRVTTIRMAADDSCRPEDLSRPGHVFPLLAQSGGVLSRRGHTEGTVDLVRLAGYRPAGVLCEMTNKDGTMSRLPEIADFARLNSMPLLSIEDIVVYREKNENQLSP